MSKETIEKDIEAGRQKLRELKITFTEFKRRVSALHTNPATFEEDEWVWFFNCYAEGIGVGYVQTIEEWAINHFQDFTDYEHETQLNKP